MATEIVKLPEYEMFPTDPLWAYIGVPAAIVFTLVLIKLRQEKMDKHGGSEFFEDEEEEQPLEEAAVERSVEAEETERKTEVSEKEKPQGCPHYLGYLYMRKAPEKTHLPTECYDCQKLLQCLYSPNIIKESTNNENHF